MPEYPFCSGALEGTLVELPISSGYHGNQSLSHSSCGGKARLAPSLQPMVIVLPANRGENPPLHTRPYLAGTLRPLPSRAPGPPGQTLSPSLSGAPFRSLRLVGHATHPLSATGRVGDQKPAVVLKWERRDADFPQS